MLYNPTPLEEGSPKLTGVSCKRVMDSLTLKLSLGDFQGGSVHLCLIHVMWLVLVNGTEDDIMKPTFKQKS